MKWTPLQIEVLLAIKCGRFGTLPMHSSRAGAQAVRLFEELQMIEFKGTPSAWTITEKGEAFVQKILHTPIPVAKVTWEFPE